MTRVGWVASLAGTPAASTADESYDRILARRGSHAFARAIFRHESSDGTKGICAKYVTRSPGNTRSSRNGTGRVVNTDVVQVIDGVMLQPSGQGEYVRYDRWPDGWDDLAFRLIDPAYVYAEEGRTSIAQILPRFAPSSDSNDPEAYIRAVVAHMNQLIESVPSMPEPPYSQFIRGLVDIRDQLPTASGANRGPTERTTMDQRRGVVIHYNGPAVSQSITSLQFLKIIAQYHVDKNWARAGQTPVYGTGLMYHVAIGNDGTKYLCRDLERVLWHCGAWPQNEITLAIQTCIGADQHLNDAQLRSLTEVVDDWCKATSTPKAEVWGHQELSSTSCPGTVMADWVYPYRDGGFPVADGRFFAETGHFVGGGFWDYWQANGGLMVFGYPLTEEIQEDGRTVQYFERAVFEFHPENADSYKILLRRLGAEALGRKAA